MLNERHKSSHVCGIDRAPSKTSDLFPAMLYEGSSMRSISRLTDTSINTVSKLLVHAGNASAAFHDEKVRGCRRQARPVRRD